MLARERQQKIISLLQKNGKTRIDELSRLFSVTNETLRRDLTLLEKEHSIEKVHGGAILSPQGIKESSFYTRKTENIEEKQVISELAVSFIKKNETVMFDASSTVFYLAEKIEHRNDIMVVTNSLKTLNILTHSKAKIIGLGGELDCSVHAFVGTQTLKNLDKLYVNHSFISCHGLDMKLGMMDISPEEVAIKEKFLTNSSTRYLLIDNSKLGKKGVVKIEGLMSINYIITDKKPSQEWIDFFDSFSAQLIYPSISQKIPSIN